MRTTRDGSAERRGGHRPRRADDLSVWVQGRWGRRRLRVGECATIIRAEEAYQAAVVAGVAMVHNELLATRTSQGLWLEGVVVPNPVWRHGRFLWVCGCGRRASRLYVPMKGAPARCRRCWGLGYASQAWNYRGMLHERFPLYLTTDLGRSGRRYLR